MQVLFSLSFLAFAVVASQTGAEDPLTEGTQLVDMLLQETSKAMSKHEASTPCAGFQGETAAIQTELKTKEGALIAARKQFAAVKASITIKTNRVHECDRELTAADEIIKTANDGEATMRKTYATSEASWQARIDETKQVSDQIAAWQQHSIGGQKLSLLQSSLLQLGEQVSLPVKNILDAASIAHLGKQTSEDSSVRVLRRFASLSPSLIEKVDVAALLKELFAKIQIKLQAHLAKLKEDKAAEMQTIQEELKAKGDARSAGEKKKTDLAQEKTNLASEITTLTEQRDSLSNGVVTASTASQAIEKELDANAAAISACKKKFDEDLKALRGEHNAVQAIKTQLTTWKDVKKPCPTTAAGCRALLVSKNIAIGGASFSFEGSYSTKGCYAYNHGTYSGIGYFGTGGNEEQMRAAPTGSAYQYRPCGGMGKSLKDVIAKVSVKPCKDFKGCAAGEFQVGECTSVTSTVSCTACKQACDVGNYMVGTCDGSGKSDTIQCQSCGTCAEGEVMKHECGGETTSDTHTCGEYSFVHDGHCASGWIGGNTKQNTIEACYAHCAKNANCGYFAYAKSHGGCAMYSTAGGCKDDNQHPEYNAYRIG